MTDTTQAAFNTRPIRAGSQSGRTLHIMKRGIQASAILALVLLAACTIRFSFSAGPVMQEGSACSVPKTFEAMTPPSSSPGDNEARDKVTQALRVVGEAEKKGGDVSRQVAELNSALNMIQEAESTGDDAKIVEASALLDQVIAEAPGVGAQGLVAAQWRHTVAVVALGIEALGAAAAYIWGPLMFWKLWLRSKGRWNVRTVE